MDKVRHLIQNWGQDAINGISWAALISWLKYFMEHFVDIGWSVGCAIITTYAVHRYKKYLKEKEGEK